jgi:hypothetical protein
MSSLTGFALGAFFARAFGFGGDHSFDGLARGIGAELGGNAGITDQISVEDAR